MQTIVQKLSSRKLWAMILGIIIGVATVMGVDMTQVNDLSSAIVAAVGLLAGAGVTGVSVKSYITGEAAIDAANVSSNTTHTEQKETVAIQKTE